MKLIEPQETSGSLRFDDVRGKLQHFSLDLLEDLQTPWLNEVEWLHTRSRDERSNDHYADAYHTGREVWRRLVDVRDFVAEAMMSLSSADHEQLSLAIDQMARALATYEALEPARYRRLMEPDPNRAVVEPS